MGKTEVLRKRNVLTIKVIIMASCSTKINASYNDVFTEKRKGLKRFYNPSFFVEFNTGLCLLSNDE